MPAMCSAMVFPYNKTEQQIIDDYKPTNIQPIESGEVGGNRYSLYDAPIDSDPELPTDE